jgi:hypothetical protein
MPPFGPMAGRRRRVNCASSPFGCPGFTAKGRRNRLTTIFELPCRPESNFLERPFRAFRKGVLVSHALSRSVLRKACFAALAAGLIFLCVDFASGNSPYTSATASEGRCGPTATDALNAAQAVLASNDPKRDRAALVCLLAAVYALDGELQGLEQGKQHLGVIKVPQHPDANQRGP